MVETMTPSEDITAGQIGKFQELLGAALRKSGLPSISVQRVLEDRAGTLIADLVAALRTAVEAISEMFSRYVTIDQTHSAQQALDATGRRQYTNAKVVAAMPRGRSQEEVFFFKLGRYVSDDELEQEFAQRNLVPADPYSLAKVNQDDSAFADTHPNGTHFKDAKGNWCFASFGGWCGGRSVRVDRRDGGGWGSRWWFAGLRK